MVSKCANPNCLVPFLYLGRGALFLFEVISDPKTSGGDDNPMTEHKGPHRLETFWLCERCSSSFMVRMVRGKVEIVRRGVAASGISPRSGSEFSERAEAKSGQMSGTDSNADAG